MPWLLSLQFYKCISKVFSSVMEFLFWCVKISLIFDQNFYKKLLYFVKRPNTSLKNGLAFIEYHVSNFYPPKEKLQNRTNVPINQVGSCTKVQLNFPMNYYVICTVMCCIEYIMRYYLTPPLQLYKNFLLADIKCII